MKNALRKRASSMLSALAIGLSAAMPAFGSLYLIHDFQTSNQSMWGPGAASSLEYTNSLPIRWALAGGANDMGCFLDWCAGSVYSYFSTGNLRLNTDLTMDGGSINASLPAQIDLVFPNLVERVTSETSFTVSTRVVLGPGQMTTITPSVSANLDLLGQASAIGYGALCWVSDCAAFSAARLIDGSPPIEIAALNRNNDSELRILGHTAALPGSGTINGVGYTALLPDISATGTGAITLMSVGTSDFLDLNGNFVNVGGSAGPIDYQLLSLGLDVDIGLAQVLTFTPFVHVALDVAETGQRIAYDSFPFLPFYSPPIVFPDYLRTLHITPTFTMDGILTNATLLTLDADFFASGLSITAPGGLSAGPLLHQSYGEGPQAISLFSDSFTLGGFDSFAGPAFTVHAPEPGSLLLVATGLFGMMHALVRRRSIQ